MLYRCFQWIKAHPKIAFGLYLTLLLGVLVVGAEVVLRLSLRFNPGYYVAYARPRPGLVLEYPYGIIKFNNDGYPDDEFEAVKTRPRVAYIGDSNCYGVGAGYGHRLTELLEQRFPELEHMNLSFGIGAKGITRQELRKILRETERYDLDAVVYIMTLNDVLPDQVRVNNPQDGRYRERTSFKLRRKLDWLRGRSYLYTYVRTLAKNHYVRKGYDIGGQKAYEMFPERYADVFRATAARIDEAAVALAERDVDFLALILPYEMQISRDAAETYAAQAIEWEGDGFIDRGPQRQILGSLTRAGALDLYYAFVDEQAVERDRATHRVGEYFVYDEGDKLDWHHPNRKGHLRIADYIERSAAFTELVAGRVAVSSSSPPP